MWELRCVRCPVATKIGIFTGPNANESWAFVIFKGESLCRQHFHEQKLDTPHEHKV